MPRSPLYGRRIHISGSIDPDPAVATADEVAAARELISALVPELVRRGANFVVPIDADPVRISDGAQICFDWLVLRAIHASLVRRPDGVPGTMVVAVQHHKTEDQVPPQHAEIWDDLCAGPLVRIENAAHWNMASKRMEAQARYGDVLLTVGGTEGVLFLANLYHDAGKPVVPLDLPVVAEGAGSRRLHAFGLSSANTSRLFRMAEGADPHAWLNRIRFPARRPVAERVAGIVDLLEALEPPTAFAVRLLATDHPDYPSVQDFFDVVVKPVVEGEFGYRLVTIDGGHTYEHARVDQEIFARLHRAGAVVADVTGGRPNCFLELGYALGRSLRTIVTSRDGSDTPFDITTLSGHRWKADGRVEDRRRAFREHWAAVRDRPALVGTEGLVP